MAGEHQQKIQWYLKNAKSRVKSARILVGAKQYNDAISRIYYAFFDAATAALLNDNLTAKTHHGLVVLFEKNFIATQRMKAGIGRWLHRAQDAREEADYEIYKKFDKDMVEKGIEAATEFIKEIEKIINK